jgi:hypothetical protein
MNVLVMRMFLRGGKRSSFRRNTLAWHYCARSSVDLPSERAFSSGRQIVDHKRNRLGAGLLGKRKIGRRIIL